MRDLNDPNLYINRELSWLKFNSRVLSIAKNRDKPLLERLKFIAIYSTNLDEFYMIRVAGLKQLYKAGISVTASDLLSPKQQLTEIRESLKREKVEVEKSYQEIVAGLKLKGLNIINYQELSIPLQKEADEYFFKNIFPVIIPIAVDSTHPFPHLNNLSFAIAVKLKDGGNRDKDENPEIKFGMVRVPRVLPRFVQVGKNNYIPIESLVVKHINSIFPGYDLLSSAPFRVTRNADIVIEEEEADDFMLMLEEGLRLRKKGAFVRLEIQKNSDEELLEFLSNHIRVSKEDIYNFSIPLNLGQLWDIVTNKDFSDLTIPPNTPKTLLPFNSNESIFDIMKREDILIFHPYESFEPVVKLIQTASKDPYVLSIRITLYRVEKYSPIIKALIEAANNGKQVTAVVELKARFDEENNLQWAKTLEDAGAHVIYGIAGFKVHAKVVQVIRKEEEGLKFYMQFGTGNYNSQTAKIYSDASYFTVRDDFAEDVIKFFQILTGYVKFKKLHTLSMSPNQIKDRVIAMIRKEAEEGEKGAIIAKVNSLVDEDVIKELYKASSKGVKIDLIIRGICCLKPQVKGVSENIRVISIVGKYLEHARIFYFKHSNPNIYISSADWMPRNLERRLELMTPIIDEHLSKKIYDILSLQLKDTELAWELQSDATYKKRVATEKPLDSQVLLENYINKVYKMIAKEKKSSIQKVVNKLLKES